MFLKIGLFMFTGSINKNTPAYLIFEFSTKKKFPVTVDAILPTSSLKQSVITGNAQATFSRTVVFNQTPNGPADIQKITECDDAEYLHVLLSEKYWRDRFLNTDKQKEFTTQDRTILNRVKHISQEGMLEYKQKYGFDIEFYRLLYVVDKKYANTMPFGVVFQILPLQSAIANVLLRKPSAEELRRVIPGWLNQKDVMQSLIGVYPELYLSERELILSGIRDPEKERILIADYEQGTYPDGVGLDLVRLMNKTFSQYTDSVFQFYKKISLKYETAEGLDVLIPILVNKDIPIKNIISAHPDVIIKSPYAFKALERLICLDSIYSLKSWFPPELIRYVFNNTSKWTKYHLLMDSGVYSLFTVEELLPLVEEVIDKRKKADYERYEYDKIICYILQNWQWEKTEPVGALSEYIRKCAADIQYKNAEQIIDRLCGNNFEYLPKWWPVLSDSCKVRALITFSYCLGDSYIRSKFEQIIQAEPESTDTLAYVVLNYIKVFFLPQEEKQSQFMVSHDMLIDYILHCFNTGENVSHSLIVLLDKCFQSNIDTPYFCDGKLWPNADGVFCPFGKYRPCAQSKCQYYFSADFSMTPARTEHDRKLATFHDLLMNIGFEPDLYDLIGNNYEAQEYSHRIASYVDRLIDMRERMKCRVCGEYFVADFRYSKKLQAKLSTTMFDCPNAEKDDRLHDKRVYLNSCRWCGAAEIDSRYCKYTGNESKYYLCMQCGGGNDNDIPGNKCPNCGADTSTVSPGSWSVECPECGYTIRIPTWKAYKLRRMAAGNVSLESPHDVTSWESLF